MHSQLFNNQNELMIQRCGQGVQLLDANQNKHAINPLALSKIYSMPFSVYFLDLNGSIQSANNVEAEILDRLSVKEILGKTVNDLITPEAAELIRNNDRAVIKTNTRLIKDELLSRCDGITVPCLTIKQPCYSNHCLIGVFGMSLIIDPQRGLSLADSMHFLAETGLLASSLETPLFPGLISNDIYFTKREKEILSHLIRGKSAQMIAVIFNRSKRTIEHHIENMKIKTNSQTKSELIEKVVDRF